MNKELLLQKLLQRRLISPDTDCWVWTKFHDQCGYGVFKINRKDAKSVHRLSAWIFFGFNLDSEMCVLHKCDNPPCFNPDHLFIGTQKDNAIDRERKGRGRDSSGENAPKAKLNKVSVLQIREALRDGVSPRDLVDLYGVTRSTISKIKLRKTWRDVEE